MTNLFQNKYSIQKEEIEHQVSIIWRDSYLFNKNTQMNWTTALFLAHSDIWLWLVSISDEDSLSEIALSGASKLASAYFTLFYRSVHVLYTGICHDRWTAGEWLECSTSCGAGVQFRHVSCQQVHKNGMLYPVDAKHCAANEKPDTSRPCNEDKSCPAWQTGEWTPVSQRSQQGHMYSCRVVGIQRYYFWVRVLISQLMKELCFLKWCIHDMCKTISFGLILNNVPFGPARRNK